MSFLLTVSDGSTHLDKYEDGNFPVFYDDENQKLMTGYAFHDREKELLNCGWEDDPHRIQDFDESAVLVSYGGDKVVICSDILGCVKTYYYHGNGTLIVSDDFWRIVKQIEPSEADIDFENVRKRLLVGGIMLGEQTIIKNLNNTLPLQKVVYDMAADQLTIEDYQLFRFSGEVTDIDEAVDSLDRILDQTMKDIKEKHGDVVYGIGLSGGLDSRAVLHYALKNHMRVSCFIVGKKRPHGIFKGRSVNIAEKIAKAYHVPLRILEWDDRQIRKVQERLVRVYHDGPLIEASKDLFKYVPDWEPGFEVLLTGGGWHRAVYSGSG